MRSFSLLKKDDVNICGSLSLLLKGLEKTNIPVDSLIGKPITDADGVEIGVITKVDIDRDLWHGQVSNLPISTNSFMSIEIRRAK